MIIRTNLGLSVFEKKPVKIEEKPKKKKKVEPVIPLMEEKVETKRNFDEE